MQIETWGDGREGDKASTRPIQAKESLHDQSRLQRKTEIEGLWGRERADKSSEENKM
jgi:hypothetical protein